MNLFKVPRMIIPRENYGKWAVTPPELYAGDRAYWENAGSAAGDPAALRMILPEVYGDEDLDARIAAAGEAMYAALEDGLFEKLNRGFLLVQRETAAGLRSGILGCIDLEAYSVRGEGHIFPAMEADPVRLARERALRDATPLEYGRAVVVYRDKRRKIERLLSREALEEVYAYDVEGQGHVAGYYLPEDLAEMVAELMCPRSSPDLCVFSGAEIVGAAKAQWEDCKKSLRAEECENHPARFLLVEFVDLYEETFEPRPLHRVLCDVDAEAFCDFFMKNLKCKRTGNVVKPVKSGVAAVRDCDALIARFLQANGGQVKYVRGAELQRLCEDADSAGVFLTLPDKEEIFESAVKGTMLPREAFAAYPQSEARRLLEMREDAYD